MSIFALKVSEDMRSSIFNSLKGEGIARFTWSYVEEGNLLTIKEQINNSGWNSLNNDQKECWKANFMLNIQPDDYIVYINVPSYGECTIAKVTSEYFWGWDSYKMDGSHCLHIDKGSIQVFNRNDEGIPSNLSRRFKLQGKYWRIYLETEFTKLVEDLKEGRLSGKNATPESRLTNCINSNVKPYLDKICEELQKFHTGKHLEELIASVLKKIPNVENVQIKSGTSDKGGDIIFEYKNELGDILGFQKVEKVAIQVKSYEGTINYAQAINDLENIFNYDSEITTGIIMTTATQVSNTFKEKLDSLKEKYQKNVSIIYGSDFANWILKYGYSKEN
ncbi:restriction endonuclease [Fusobacterium sp. SYSU M8A802]